MHKKFWMKKKKSPVKAGFCLTAAIEVFLMQTNEKPGMKNIIERSITVMFRYSTSWITKPCLGNQFLVMLTLIDSNFKEHSIRIHKSNQREMRRDNKIMYMHKWK